MDWRDYTFMAKNQEVVTVKPDERPSFGGPLLPKQTRGQLIHVLEAALGRGEFAEVPWEIAVGHYDSEMGTYGLDTGKAAAQYAAADFIDRTDGIESLDLVGVALLVAEQWCDRLDVGSRELCGINMPAEKATAETNRFLREGNVPYQFDGGHWIHVTSEYVHQEIVRPALEALERPGFTGALDEFKTALDRAREGRTKDAVTEATKALESTVKCICAERKWDYPKGATASQLFDVIAGHELVPDWMENGFIAAATIRNKMSAHGQGTEPKPLPPHLAELAVNLAASQIIALVAAHDALA